tara:strand:+ start:1226 stop:1447 length:222 start_codon:yes stop_codon:yes gene_type:complete
MADLLRALEKKLEGDIEVSKANIMVYQENPSGIGEHPEVVQAVEVEVQKLADAQDKLQAVKNLLHPQKVPLTE